MSKHKDLIKSIVKKNAAEKPTFGTDPRDPWSTKSNVTEDAALNRFLLSRGINPKHVTKDQKVAHSKMGEFLKWKRDHMYEQTSEPSPTIKRQRELEQSKRHQTPIVKGVAEAKDEEYSDPHMAVNQLKTIMHNAEELIEMLGDDTDLPEWVESKITLAEDYIMTVANYMRSEMHESYNGPRGDKLIAVSHAAYDAGDKAKSKRAHTLAMKAGERYRSNPVNRDKAISHIMSGANKDYTSGKTRTNDSVEIDGTPIQEGSAALRLAQALRKEREARELKDKSREAAERNEKARQTPMKTESALEDPQSATQTPFDGANSPDDSVNNKRMAEMSKSARIIKSIYKKKGMNEELYDHEKESKSVASYGKKPKMSANEKKMETVGAQPKAAAVMSGGTTLTGETRDTVEIDPMMKVKPGLMGQADKPKFKNK